MCRADVADVMKAMGSGKRGPMAGLAQMMGFGGGMPSPEEIAKLAEKMPGGLPPGMPGAPGGLPLMPGGLPKLPGLPGLGGKPADASRVELEDHRADRDPAIEERSFDRVAAHQDPQR